MLKASRVGTTMDVSRVAAAVRSPGIDTRTWTSLAVVTAVHVDEAEGTFVDVTLLPSRREETARAGCAYAGPGFGLHAPVDVDDEVLVAAPEGDPDHGLVVVARLHSASDPPPQQVVDHPADVVLVVKPGQSVRLVVEGGGHVILTAGDGGSQVRLGGEDASSAVARVGDSVVLSSTGPVTDLQAALDGRYQLRPSPPPLDLTAGLKVATIATGSDQVKST